ncbi:MAG: FAD-dependent oxidoreductase [Deltaproteobacteria bacterium]|nr:FAD-dependent oxidoreductase [Deltaproteobacteria bacterium]
MTDTVSYSTEPEDFFYMGVNVPCQSACPADTNIPAYIRALSEEAYDDSYEINRIANILPGVLGRICSRPCEEKCRHGEPELGKPVNICHIKRAASDYRKRLPASLVPPLAHLHKSVAIIGSGPAGLAAAHDLSTVGVSVTVYEALPEPGGMLRYGIPEFRLPRSLLDQEINRIFEKGVRLVTGTRIGVHTTLETLLADHDAVLLAAGCYEPNSLDVPGEGLPGVCSGLDFMMDIGSGKTPVVGKRVLVIGAGFTAFDCARSALRLGAEDVAICLRRTEEDLAVTREEVLETKIEGVKIHSLMLSRRVVGARKVERVEFVRTRPGAPQADGKSSIAPIEGSEFFLPADSVIVAAGQKAASFKYSVKGPGEKGQEVMADQASSYGTTVPGIYMAGDCVTGPSTVIEAIGMGRRAAERILRDLTGNPFRERVVRMEEVPSTDRRRVWDFLPRREMPVLKPLKDRLTRMDKEVETGLSPENAMAESKRCYLCYLHYEIDLDRCIYCRYCIDVAPRDCIKLVDTVKTNDVGAVTGFVETDDWGRVNAVVIDNSRCIRCGECLRVCPVDCISVTRVELTERNAAQGDSHG